MIFPVSVQTFFYQIPPFVGVLVNPIIYGALNSDYRRAFMKILKIDKCWRNSAGVQSASLQDMYRPQIISYENTLV
jgi:hypothetical protein